MEPGMDRGRVGQWIPHLHLSLNQMTIQGKKSRKDTPESEPCRSECCRQGVREYGWKEVSNRYTPESKNKLKYVQNRAKNPKLIRYYNITAGVRDQVAYIDAFDVLVCKYHSILLHFFSNLYTPYTLTG